MEQEQSSCWKCNGRGSVRFMLFFSHECPICHGSGVIRYTPSSLSYGISNGLSSRESSLSFGRELNDYSARKIDNPTPKPSVKPNLLHDMMDRNNPMNINSPKHPLNHKNPHNINNPNHPLNPNNPHNHNSRKNPFNPNNPMNINSPNNPANPNSALNRNSPFKRNNPPGSTLSTSASRSTLGPKPMIGGSTTRKSTFNRDPWGLDVRLDRNNPSNRNKFGKR